MRATFVELPFFSRYRSEHLDDESFRALQLLMLKNPACGDVIQGTGGLRKMRFTDDRRHKGKRGGLRVIYYWWVEGRQFWLFTVYGKDDLDNLDPSQRNALAGLLKAERMERRQQ